MKRIITLIGLLLIGVSLSAQGRFFSIIFADTDDDRIGIGATKSMNFIINMTNELSVGLDIPKEEVIYDGRNCSKEMLLKWLKSFECTDEDIVVFCYLGHGSRSFKDTSIFPQMCLGAKREDLYVSLEATKDAIMAKGPRFALVIGDCCNSKDVNVTPKFSILNASGETNMFEMSSNNIRKMFLEQKGYILTTGSTAGEYSWVNNSETSPIGMIYTTVFTDYLHQYLASVQNCSWEDFLSSLKTMVGKIACTSSNDGRVYFQNPIYRIGVPKQPKQYTSKKNNPDIKHQETITAQLMAIADARKNSYDGIELAHNTFRNRFTRDAIVTVVGRDNQTVLSEQRAEEYLNRISTARRLRGVSVIDEEKDDNGMISKLVVHEIYLRKNNQ